MATKKIAIVEMLSQMVAKFEVRGSINRLRIARMRRSSSFGVGATVVSCDDAGIPNAVAARASFSARRQSGGSGSGVGSCPYERDMGGPATGS